VAQSGLRHDRGQSPRLSEKGIEMVLLGHATHAEASCSVSELAPPRLVSVAPGPLTELLVLEAKGFGRA
jgi:hypothetical protein